jgi:hypothetical protein
MDEPKRARLECRMLIDHFYCSAPITINIEGPAMETRRGRVHTAELNAHIRRQLIPADGSAVALFVLQVLMEHVDVCRGVAAIVRPPSPLMRRVKLNGDIAFRIKITRHLCPQYAGTVWWPRTRKVFQRPDKGTPTT